MNDITDEAMREALARAKPNTEPEEAKRIMEDDPGVNAGGFVYEAHACRSFTGDAP